MSEPRDVGKDQQAHWITGIRVPVTGTPGGIVQQVDDWTLSYQGPMGEITAGVGDGVFGSESAETINQNNLAQSANKCSGIQSFGAPIDMGEASANVGGAGGGKSGDVYGFRHGHTNEEES